MKELPEGFKDAIHVVTDIRLGFMDRIKILIGYRVTLKSITYCENLPGKCQSESDLRIYRINKKHIGYVAKEKP